MLYFLGMFVFFFPLESHPRIIKISNPNPAVPLNVERPTTWIEKIFPWQSHNVILPCFFGPFMNPKVFGILVPGGSSPILSRER